MNPAVRAWRVLADDPKSGGAKLLRVMIPIYVVAALPSLVPGLPWPVPLHRLIDAAWLYVVLWAIRQRDDARAEPKREQP